MLRNGFIAIINHLLPLCFFFINEKSEKMSISGHPVAVPQGEIKKTGLKSRFTHNEWLVYDEGQVHMKYLVKARWVH